MARVDLQFWKNDRAGTQLSAGFSVLAHAVVITAWIIATLPSPHAASTEPDTRVWYHPPPNPKPARSGSIETLRYVELAPIGLGSGFGPVAAGIPDLATRVPDSETIGDAGRDSTTSAEVEGPEGQDSVFTIVDVDSAASRLAESAAPRYPAELLQQRVEGRTIVQFVVDTNGLADVRSFMVLASTHPEFVEAVREALPGMRFSAARVGAHKVRQLVELPFIFNIADSVKAQAEAPRAAARQRPPE